MAERSEEREEPKDDLDAYLTTLDEDERAEVVAAAAAIDKWLAGGRWPPCVP